MNSRIEDIIAQIQEYIDGCKYQAFSSSKIIVDREELYGLLEDLHASVPVEIERHRQIIANKEEILNDARKKANEVMALSSRKAEDVLRQANEEATAYRESAVAYVEGLLDELETLSTHTLAQANDSHSVLSASLENYIRTLRENKKALVQESLVSDVTEDAEDASGEEIVGGSTEELKLI